MGVEKIVFVRCMVQEKSKHKILNPKQIQMTETQRRQTVVHSPQSIAETKRNPAAVFRVLCNSFFVGFVVAVWNI
jgi:hypothetical protein